MARWIASRWAANLRYTAGEIAFLLGSVAVLWLAAYLYELGYAARFQIPLALVDVGFPRLLAVLIALALATAGAAAAIMLAIERAYPFLVERGARGARTTRRAATLLATLWVGAALLLVPADEFSTWVADEPLGLDVDPVRLALIAGLLVQAAALGTRWRALATDRRWPVLSILSAALLLCAMVPASLGWWEAGRRADTGRAFFTLAEAPDYRLVRLYGSRAVFAHWDPETRRFDGGWRTERFDREETLWVKLQRAPR